MWFGPEEAGIDSVTLDRSIKKSIKDLQQSLGNVDDSDTRIKPIYDRLIHMVQEMKKTEFEMTRIRRKTDLICREKDLLKLELRKSNSVRAKLENLCRELQKDNKRIRVRMKKCRLNIPTLLFCRTRH